VIAALLLALVACNSENADDDGDGLTNGEEATRGSDPAVPDSDGDGVNDGDEVTGGTSPTWKWSKPYEGGYLVGACPDQPDESKAGPTGTATYNDGTNSYSWDAYAEGDTLHNLADDGADSFGQLLPVYAFCGNWTLVTSSAMWCPPCQALADEMAADMAEIQATVPNFTFYEFLTEDGNYGAGQVPTQAELQRWRNNHELDGIPVVAPAEADDERNSWLNASGYIPSSLLLAPDMTVAWSNLGKSEVGLGDPATESSPSTVVRKVLRAIERYEDATAR
jgi:thiol-disulfide isomerase/thioredoxin